MPTQFCMHTHLKSEDILKRLVLSPRSECPFRTVILDVRGDDLIETALRNKMLHLLFHFITCHYCRKHVDPELISRVTVLELALRHRNAVRHIERKALMNIAGRFRIPILFYKESPIDSPLSRRKISDDIDILIAPKYVRSLSRAYAKKKYRTSGPSQKEIEFTSKKSQISIDIHWLIAYPPYRHLRSLPIRSIRQLSSEMIKHTLPNKNGPTLTVPYYAVLLVVLFWYNDLGFGMYSLYALQQLLSGCSTANLERTAHICKRYGLLTLFGGVASLAFSYYGKPVPARLHRQFRVSPRVTLILPYLQKHFVVSRMRVGEWSVKNAKTKSHYKNYGIVDLILNEYVPFVRLLRPQILWVYMRSVLYRAQCFLGLD